MYLLCVLVDMSISYLKKLVRTTKMGMWVAEGLEIANRVHKNHYVELGYIFQGLSGHECWMGI